MGCIGIGLDDFCRLTPFKYFRLALPFTLSKDESLQGCTVQFRPRLMNRPR